MIPSAPLFAYDWQMLPRLQRRDRYALLLYVFFGALIMVAGEAAAFYPGMADRHGYMPLLVRSMVYLLLPLTLWAALLRVNRRPLAAHGERP